MSCDLQQLSVTEKNGGISFDIIVSPRASRNRFGPMSGDRIKIFVTSPPVEGKANDAIIALVARCLGVRKNAVSIVTGDKGKRKVIHVTGATLADLEKALQ